MSKKVVASELSDADCDDIIIHDIVQLCQKELGLKSDVVLDKPKGSIKNLLVTKTKKDATRLLKLFIYETILSDCIGTGNDKVDEISKDLLKKIEAEIEQVRADFKARTGK